jgi:hypothetical protein
MSHRRNLRFFPCPLDKGFAGFGGTHLYGSPLDFLFGLLLASLLLEEIFEGFARVVGP